MGKVKKCGFCNGTGKVWSKPDWFNDSPFQMVCKKCNGKGVK
jgi:DnaJ-class molecular chaperone